MSGLFPFALTAAVNVAAFVAGYTLGRGGKRRAVLTFAGILLLLCGKAVLGIRPDWEYSLFPYRSYRLVQSWLGFPLGLACLGLGTALLGKARDRRALAVLSLVFLAGLMAVDVFPQRTTGAVKGVIGLFSYVGAATQDWISGILIDLGKTGTGESVTYSFDYAFIFWVAAGILSLAMALTIWNVKPRA